LDSFEIYDEEINVEEINFRPRKDGLDKIFHLPVQPFGIGDTERCIEIPWAVSCYAGERRVLDVGYSNAEDRYLNSLLNLRIPELYGLDVVSRAVPGIVSVAGDMRQMPFHDAAFDLIFCVSTIEHVGWDNTIYYQGPQVLNPEGDLQAIRELGNITRRGGKIVVTVPYGKLHNYGWFLQYDQQRFDRLIHASGCHLLKKDLFLYREGWHRTSEEALKGVLYKDNNAPAAAGLACALLEKLSDKPELNSPNTRCLCVAVQNITLIERKSYQLDYVNGFYNIENWSGTLTRWMQADATILVNSPENRTSTLSLDVQSFYRKRTLEISFDGVLAAQVVVPTSFINVGVPINLAKGANTVQFHVREGCKRPSDIEELNNPDDRCLCVAVQNLMVM